MQINTAVFGPVEVDKSDIFHLKDGLLGFDGIFTYALITRQEDEVTLRWFQAVDANVPCFFVFDPFDIVDGYSPELDKSDLKALGNPDAEDLSYLAIAVIPDDITQTTVNLKSPIVLNRKDNTARQVILCNKDYPIRFALSENEA